ncbi:glycosyltransferase family 9 protein [Tropicimonas sp. IMCC34011]|uniref:glycosyltransferase family 9 protein n=1 Tax=Tropicimonas sp. IMCC34011 TaxID=2248759 RepID=UPI000E26514F|nr:glycosyltransferase family 9 protein [Tropicimonas sp. IMCC34011]
MTRPILIYRLGSFGDTVVALPCFHAINRAFPGRERIVLTNMPVAAEAPPLMAVLGQHGQFADRVLTYPVGTRDPRVLARLARQIRKTGADEAVWLMPERSSWAIRRDVAFFRLAGIRTIHCLPKTEEERRARVHPGTGETEREAFRLLRCCAELTPGDIPVRLAFDLKLTDAEVRAGRAAREPFGGLPFIAINMGGKAATKDWGAGNWTELARIIGRYDIGVMAIGAAEDRGAANCVLSAWPGPVANLCGTLSPRVSGAAMRRALAFIGHDSGPLHLAAALGVPTIGLFGDHNAPRQWHPMGQDVQIIHRTSGMRDIGVEEVANMLDPHLTVREAAE